MTTLNQLTVKAALDGLQAKKFTGAKIWQACQTAIEKDNQKLNVYLEIFSPEQADKFLSQASTEQTEQVLAGIPLALKDNFCLKESTTTASSNVLRNFKPPYTATVVQRLAAAGARFLGKTNLDAWAHGSSTLNSDFGPTKNPRNPDYLPGGSSGGSAAAVAGDLCLAALGSETAGSVRQPASWCGCVGFRPTYGRASRYGVVAMASSLDSPGFLTKTVEDAALLTPIICGKDPLDATTSPEKLPDLKAHLKKDLQGKKIGFLYLDIDGLAPEIKAHYQKTWQELEEAGAQVEAVNARDPREAIAVYTVVQRSEVSSNLGRYDGIRYGENRTAFGNEAKRRAILGTFLLSTGYADRYYWQAQKVRTLFVQDFAQLFAQYDVLVCPTTP
ncbi:MAG: amidase family protein, partial [bacterium]|nr:amidase family protein [bacterium]